MSAPTLQGSWSTRANQLFPLTTTAANINNSYFHMFMAGLLDISTSGTIGPEGARPASTRWTVEGSSDGTNAALDGVNRLTGSVLNSFNNAAWVHAASGSAHSWIVMKSPTLFGPVYCCVDLNSATTTTAGIVFSREAFVQGTINGRPITNNGWCAGSTADPVATTSAAIISDQTLSSTYYFHIAVESSGGFVATMSRAGGGLFSSFLWLNNNVERNSADTSYPTWCIFNAVNTTRGSPTYGTIGAQASAVNGRTVTGTAANSAGGLQSMTFGGTQFGGAATIDQGMTNFRTLPMYIQSMVASNMSWRGRVPDMWAVGNCNVGDSYPNTSTPTQHIVGDVLIPMSVVPII